MEMILQHDVRLRAAARAIYDACYPGDEWAPVGFDEAERCGTVHYRQAVGAALEAREVLSAPVQPELWDWSRRSPRAEGSSRTCNP